MARGRRGAEGERPFLLRAGLAGPDARQGVERGSAFSKGLAGLVVCLIWPSAVPWAVELIAGASGTVGSKRRKTGSARVSHEGRWSPKSRSAGREVDAAVGALSDGRNSERMTREESR